MKLTVFALLLVGSALAVLTVVFRSGMQQFELDPHRQVEKPSASIATVSASTNGKPIHPWLKKAHRTAYSAPRSSPVHDQGIEEQPEVEELAVEELTLTEPEIAEATDEAIALHTWIEELGQRELALLAAEEQWQAQQEQALKDQEAWLNEQPDTIQTRIAFAELVKVWETAAAEHEAFLATQREQVEADLAWLHEQESTALEAITVNH